MKRRGCIPAILLLFCAATAFAADRASAGEEQVFSGYYKNFLIIYDPPAALNPSGETPASDSNRLRLNLNLAGQGPFSGHISYTVTPRVQSASLFSPANAFSVTGGIAGSTYRLNDMPETLYGPSGNAAVYQNLDRAFVRYRGGAADLYAGRQAVAWGSARVINPTDVIAPFRFYELDREERIGVDAVRVRFETGPFGEMDGGAVFGKDAAADLNAFFLRGVFPVLAKDVSVLAVDFQKNLLVGFDYAGSFGGAGTWLETGYVFAGLFRDYAAAKDENYLRASLGADYSFSDRFYGYLEYHYNGAGAADPASYAANTAKTAYTQGAVYLLGVHYLIPGITWQFTPLLSFIGQSFINLTDGSLYGSPQLEYNILQNVYISAGALYGIGRRPEASPGGPVLRSEFGSYSDAYYTSFRVYY